MGGLDAGTKNRHTDSGLLSKLHLFNLFKNYRGFVNSLMVPINCLGTAVQVHNNIIILVLTVTIVEI